MRERCDQRVCQNARNVRHVVPCGAMRTETRREHFGHQPTYAVPARLMYTRVYTLQHAK